MVGKPHQLWFVNRWQKVHFSSQNVPTMFPNLPFMSLFCLVMQLNSFKYFTQIGPKQMDTSVAPVPRDAG